MHEGAKEQSVIKDNNSAGKSGEPQHHSQPISRWKSLIRDLEFLPSQITQNTAPTACSDLLLTSSSKAQRKNSYHPKFKSSKETEEPLDNNREDARTCNYFAFLQLVDLRLQVSIESPKEGEPSATNLAPNGGVNQRQSTEKSVRMNNLGAISNLSANSYLALLRYPHAQTPNDVALPQNDVA
ncbi:hypothetical protein F511_38806 [Dorcoceras hygrometricum]|uniref:Uncharacterized protein n=1 Tax=Dorcoceras hygrometricum TaxID=472368 RepID=A0A2Z7A8Q6_9LAMI|nr:hypothetical protein F511_38806 [Dorcoceras hygrometricum]